MRIWSCVQKHVAKLRENLSQECCDWNSHSKCLELRNWETENEVSFANHDSFGCMAWYGVIWRAWRLTEGVVVGQAMAAMSAVWVFCHVLCHVSARICHWFKVYKVWEAFFTVLFSIELSLRWLADGFFEFFRTKECAEGEGDGAAQGESCNTRVGMGRLGGMSVEKHWFQVSSFFSIMFYHRFQTWKLSRNHWSLRTCGGIYWTYFASSSAWWILLLSSWCSPWAWQPLHRWIRWPWSASFELSASFGWSEHLGRSRMFLAAFWYLYIIYILYIVLFSKQKVQKVQKYQTAFAFGILRHPSAQVIRIMRFFRTSDDKTVCDSILQHHRFSLWICVNICEYLWIFVNVCLADFGRELRMMVFSIMNCLKSVLWIILILFILFYMFGIIFVSGVMGYLDTLELRQLPQYDTWPPDSSNVLWISRLRGWENNGRSPFLRNDEPPRFILWEAPKYGCQ